MKKITNKGFTLIELLVVVAIIAILALVVLLALNPVEMARRSRDSRRLSDLSTLRKAIDLSLADGKMLPTGTTDRNTGTASLDPTLAGNLVGMDISKYLSKIPQDPMFTAGTATTVTAGTTCTTTPGTASKAAGEMVYRFQSDGSTYVLSAYLESKDNCKIVAEDGNADGMYELGTQANLTY